MKLSNKKTVNCGGCLDFEPADISRTGKPRCKFCGQRIWVTKRGYFADVDCEIYNHYEEPEDYYQELNELIEAGFQIPLTAEAVRSLKGEE
jgi:hypothetical protein